MRRIGLLRRLDRTVVSRGEADNDLLVEVLKNMFTFE